MEHPSRQKGKKPLIGCCHANLRRLLVKAGLHSTCCTPSGLTALHFAARLGKINLVHAILLEEIGIIDWKGKAGETAILLAAEHKRKFTVELLLQAGADIKCCNEYNENVIHFACRLGWENILEYIINKEPNLMNYETSDKQIPILIASLYAQKVIVELLLQAGANLDCCDNNGYTVLHFAVHHNWLTIVRAIIRKNKLLVDSKSSHGLTALMMACKEGKLIMAELLIRSGASLSSRDSEGHTALHHVIKGVVEKYTVTREPPNRIIIDTSMYIMYCYNSIISLLIQNGCNVHVKNVRNETALDIGILYHPILSLSPLVDCGAYLGNEENPLLKEAILKRKHFCSQLIINKFNNFLLPTVYQIYGSSNLPPIEDLRIQVNERNATEVIKALERNKKTNTFYKLTEVRPLDLKMLCVKTIALQRPSSKRPATNELHDANTAKKTCRNSSYI